MERNLYLDWPSLVQEAVARRKRQGLTQLELATLIGISKPTLIAFERGKLSLSLNTACRILDMLGLLAKPTL